MFKLLGFLLKTVFFTALVLILGNWIRWDGKTVSDRVRTSLSQAENSSVGRKVRDLAGFKSGTSESGPADGEAPLDISNTERQKLKDLIRELNRSFGKN